LSKLLLCLDTAQGLIVNQQNAIEHAMLAHQIFVGGNIVFFGRFVLLFLRKTQDGERQS